MTATADIVARLRLNAQNFTSELQKELGTAEAKFGKTGSVIGRNLAEGIGGGLQEATSKVPVLGSALSGLSGSALIAAAGVGAIAAGIAEGVRNAEQLQQAVRGLQATMAEGNRTGFSEKALIDFSEQMEMRFAVSQESIIKTEQVLAGFDNISGKTFKNAVTGAAELAAFFHDDMTGEAEKLGTVLQNLGDGQVEGLRKSFKFLGTETVKTIEDLAKTGRDAEAMAALLDAVQHHTGKVAEENAKGITGGFTRIELSYGHMTREFATNTGTYDFFARALGAIADQAERASEQMKAASAAQTAWAAARTIGMVAATQGAYLAPTLQPPRGAGGNVNTSEDIKGMLDSVNALAEARRMSKQHQKEAAANAAREAEAARTKMDIDDAIELLGGRVTSGVRTPAEQRRLYSLGLTPTLNSKHLTGEARDVVGINRSQLEEAARLSGLEGVKILNETGVGRNQGTGAHLHIEWNGHPDTDLSASQQAKAQQAKQAAEATKREHDEQQRILVTMKQQLNASVEQEHVDALRLTGLGREADLEGDLARVRAETAAQMDKLTPKQREAQEKVSDQVKEQLNIYEQQAAAFAQLLKDDGDRANLTAQQKTAEAAARTAMDQTLMTAQGMAKTVAEIRDVRLATIDVEHRLNDATEDGAKKKADEKAAADARMAFEKGLEQQRVDQARQQYQDLANFYYDAFRSGGKSIWQDFKDEGMHVLAEIAAQWTLALLSGQKVSLPGILSQLGATSNGGSGGLLSGLANLLGGSGGHGGGLGTAKGGSFIQGSFGQIGAGIDESGGFGAAAGAGASGIMGSLGSAIPPLMAAMAIEKIGSSILGVKSFAGGIFGLGGDLIASLFSHPKQAAATLSVDQYGNLVTGAAKGNDATSRSNATSEANSLAQTLESIASSLGGTLSGVGGISLGFRASDKKQPYRVDPTGQGRATGNGVLAFATEEEAAKKALEIMLQRGVVDGISAASKKILAAGGDLQKALEKATLIEAIPKALAAHLDPVGAAVDALNQKWAKTILALKEGGATTEQMADAQKEYQFELDDVKASTQEASASLKGFLKGLNFGSSSPYSLRDQEMAAKASLQPFLDQIGGGQAIDQAKYQDAAQSFLDIERQLYGSTSQYFDAMDMIQAATGKAISDIDNAKPIRTYADPFAEATAGSTQATAEILSQQLPNLGAKLDAILSALNSGGSGGGFIGGAAGFSSVRTLSASQ